MVQAGNCLMKMECYLLVNAHLFCKSQRASDFMSIFFVIRIQCCHNENYKCPISCVCYKEMTFSCGRQLVMKSRCKVKLFFKNSSSDCLTCLQKVYKRYLYYGVARFLTGHCISDKCTALQSMFVSNTALTLTLFLWLYDMGMFPKLCSVWQQPLIEISTS